MARRKNWPVIIEDWEKSGMPVSQYCLEKGLNRSNFFAWRKKLKNTKVNLENFVPVKFKEEKRSLKLSIQVGENIRIELDKNFETRQLVRVIEALREVPC